MLLPDIDGREALPLRLIPYVTNGQIGPESLVKLLAGKQGLRWYRKIEERDRLQAYRIDNHEIIEIKPPAWDSVILDIEDWSNQCKKSGASHSEWQNKAFELIPPGSFCWFDELKAVYEIAVSPKGGIKFSTDKYVSVPKTLIHTFKNKNMEVLIDWENKFSQRDGERELNLSPYLSPALHEIVFAGFENVKTLPEPSEVPAENPVENIVSEPIDFEKLVAERLGVQKQPREIIAVDLKDTHGLQLGNIARLLPDPKQSPKVSNGAWRQRGRTLVINGRKKLAK